MSFIGMSNARPVFVKALWTKVARNLGWWNFWFVILYKKRITNLIRQHNCSNEIQTSEIEARALHSVNISNF